MNGRNFGVKTTYKPSRRFRAIFAGIAAATAGRYLFRILDEIDPDSPSRDKTYMPGVRALASKCTCWMPADIFAKSLRMSVRPCMSAICMLTDCA